MMMPECYEVVNAHAWRQCHPETCCCRTDYLVVDTAKNAKFPLVKYEGNREDCNLWVAEKKADWVEQENSKRKLNFLNKVYGNHYFEPVPSEVKVAAAVLTKYMQKKNVVEIEGLRRI